ncbi:MAG: dTMP kinase [Thermogutta sp.]|nr:dTMP kinase [Thermogutta sp.]
MFICLEGGDGTGKTTQAERLASRLRDEGRKVVLCRDPGGTALGEEIRSILLHRREIPICAAAEMLLYMAARAELTEEVIRPALAEGSVVVSDRFLTSNLVYQGYANGLDVEKLRQVGLLAVGGLLPDVSIVLDMPADEAVRRIDRGLDRLESRGIEYLEKVRDGFLQEASRFADRMTVVRADRTPDEVHEAIMRIVRPLISAPRTPWQRA